MGKNGLRVFAVFGGTLLVLLLCVIIGVASYFVGRRSVTGAESAPVATEADAVQVATPVAEATVPLEVVIPTEEPQTPETAQPVETVIEATPEPLETAAVESAVNADGRFDDEDLQLMWETWDILQKEYDGELPGEQELLYAVIRGLVQGLGDAHTRFIDPDAVLRMERQFEGAYEGIGAYVQENDEGFAEIVRPIEGSPAEAAGLRPGDVVIAVDGESMVNKSLDEVISYILGPAGTEVVITFVREELPEPFDVSITRAEIVVPVVTYEMLEGDIAYIELASFNSIATEQLQIALDELLPQEPRGLILDLRNNGGGLLSQAVAVSDLFLPESVILYERSNTEEINEVFEAQDGQIGEQIPLVVLVNEFSASASEILAGAVRDNERGTLIGETTFGKGSVQLPHTLSDGSQLNVTIAHWYTPGNVNIDEEGITPDIEVELDEAALIEGEVEDLQLQRAVEFLENGN